MEKLPRLGSRTHAVILFLVGVRIFILAIALSWIILRDRDLLNLLLWTSLVIIFATQIINGLWKVKR